MTRHVYRPGPRSEEMERSLRDIVRRWLREVAPSPLRETLRGGIREDCLRQLGREPTEEEEAVGIVALIDSGDLVAEIEAEADERGVRGFFIRDPDEQQGG